ncbi:MAG: NAD(P)-dependent alcohol dehydrogenase [Roseiflexaceae bacterium]|nr:NAD(P)-dependent alcohol dehydrogenase [Roseiflexaceae bacterium]
METMHAVGFRRYGPAEVLEALELPIPAVGANMVRIRVAAAGVNPADWRLRNGQFRFVMRLALPFVPGSDIAGVVDAIGPQVTRFQPGDAVYAMLPTITGGGYAAFVAVTEQHVAHAPQSIALGDAAGVPLAGLTALQALRDRAQLQLGQRLLVYGASGGVGSFAVQIAKALGAHVTAATSGRNLDLVRELGADAVLDYTQHSVAEAQEPYDIVFDTVNTLSFRRMLAALGPNGVFVSVNPFIEKLSPAWLARFRQGKRLKSLLVQPSGSDLAALSGWIDAGQLRPLIDQRYPLAEAAAAHRHSATGRARGKLVLVVDQQLAGLNGQPAITAWLSQKAFSH